MTVVPPRINTLTLWQPWASLIAMGAKTMETRSWRPPPMAVGGLLAIHAAKTREGVKLVRSVEHHDIEMTMRAWLTSDWADDIPYGEVVAVARLAGAVQCPSERVRPDAYGDFSRGRWAWILEDIHVLKEPVSARGHQGVWTWEPPLAVREELRAAQSRRNFDLRTVGSGQHGSLGSGRSAGLPPTSRG